MGIEEMKQLSYDSLRELYKKYLLSLNLAKTTISTSYTDTFYLWRYGSKELFWNTVLSTNFENDSKLVLADALEKNSTGNVQTLVNGYISHLRKFRKFISYDNVDIVHNLKSIQLDYRRVTKRKADIPRPSVEEIEFYLEKWKMLEDYSFQEEALNRLFFKLCPKNTEIADILLKCSTLNDFYSTNIFSIYPVAKHILQLKIDKRLSIGDETLVDDIKKIEIKSKIKNFYSFATKYCSHHNPKDFPIYDSYVDVVLRYFKSVDNFSNFKNEDLKNYTYFKKVLLDFRRFYDLEAYNLKQIDQYLWQLGKDYFKKNYNKKKKL